MTPPLSATMPHAPEGPGDSSATPLPQVSGHELLHEIGRGGMGIVYKARHLAGDRTVALKMIHSGALTVADLDRFRTEIQAVAALRHPGIVTLYEVGDAASGPYFTMEFAEGGSLADHLDGTPLPPRDAAALVQQVAGAVQHAHECGIVHRDLKPANVLLARGPANEGVRPPLADLTPKIADFGLARRTDSAGHTASGAVVGTPSYMPPEQAESRRGAVGPRSDVYSLGAILYELLTGRPPFRGPTPLETLLQVIRDEPVPPRSLQPQVPADLERVCLKCLEKGPERRYASARDLGDDLGRYLNGEPVQARPIGPVGRGAKWVRRNPLLAGLVAAVVLLLLGGTGVSSYFAWTAWQQSQAAIAAQQTAESRAESEASARAFAEVQKERAELQLGRAQGLLYSRLIAQAQREFEAGHGARALQSLEECQWDLRGWEHRHLWTRFNSQSSLLGHRKAVRAVCFSPDGKRLASASGDGMVKVWDVVTGQETLTVRHDRTVEGVCFSPDGKRLASASDDGMLKVWDPQTGQLIRTLDGHKGPVIGVAFSPDGARLATAGGVRKADGTGITRGEVKIWEAETGREVHTLRGHEGLVRCVAFSPDGKQLASGGLDLTVRLWDPETGQPIRTLRTQTGLVLGLCFSPDGQRLACAGGTFDRENIFGEVKIWDPKTGKELLSRVGREGMVHAICFSPDGKRLAIGDRVVRVWDVESGKQLFTLLGKAGEINSVCFSPDGRRIASAGGIPGVDAPSEVELWDAQQGQEPVTLQGNNTRGIFRVGFDPGGKRLATVHSDRTVRVWDAKTGRELLTLVGAHAQVHGAWFSPDGGRIATAADVRGDKGDSVGVVWLWDVETGKELRTFRGHTRQVRAAAFSPDGRLLASAGGDKTIRFWDVETGQLLRTIEGPGGDFSGVCFSLDGRRLASVGGSGSRGEVKIWDAETGKEVLTLTGHNRRARCVCFSPDGRQLASAGGEMDWQGRPVPGEVKVWDLEKGEALFTFTDHAAPVNGVGFTPDGQRLATASEDQTVKLWDLRAGVAVLTLPGHCCAFSPDGLRLAVGDTTTVKIWEAHRAPLACSLPGHNGGVNYAGFSPDGQRLITVCGELRRTSPSEVRVWDAHKGLLLSSFQAPAQTGYDAALSPDGQRLAMTSVKRVKLWDVQTGREILTLDEHQGVASSVSFSPDGRRLATGSGVWEGEANAPKIVGGEIRVCDAVTGEEVVRLRGHSQLVSRVCFHPDGRRLASASQDGTVIIWNAATRQALLTFRVHKPAARPQNLSLDAAGLAFSPNGERLATAAGVGKVWDVGTGREVLTLAGPTDIRRVTFSPDSRQLVTGSRDGTVRVWDAATGKLLRALRGHIGDVNSLCFAPDGRRLASGAGDPTSDRDVGEVKVWDLEQTDAAPR